MDLKAGAAPATMVSHPLLARASTILASGFCQGIKR